MSASSDRIRAEDASRRVFDAAEDGGRKMAAAARRRFGETIPVPLIRLFDAAELSLAMGLPNVIHAAVLAQDAGNAVLKRMVALDRYRGGSPDDRAMFAAIADEEEAAEDME